VIVSEHFLLLLVGFLYIVLFGGLSYFRREGLSGQFAIEALILTFVAAGLSYFSIYTIHPVLMLILLYVVTMRVRLLVDIGNSFASRGKHDVATRLYNFAATLWPDKANHLIIQVNRAVLSLQNGFLDEAIRQFTDVLGQAGRGYLGVKYEAAAHYNLGVAFRRKGMLPQAVAEFNSAIDCWPVSLYAKGAKTALNQMRQKDTPGGQGGQSSEGQ
jgi:tetratricopeptide (TPR) repeat protein